MTFWVKTKKELISQTTLVSPKIFIITIMRFPIGNLADNLKRETKPRQNSEWISEIRDEYFSLEKQKDAYAHFLTFKIKGEEKMQ